MDNNYWRPAQEESSMNTSDWRAQLSPDSRHRILNKIMETLKRHLLISGPEGLQELEKIAVSFEEEIYTAATSQSDYLRKISLKMLTMETKNQNTGVTGSFPSNSAGSNQNSMDPDSTAQTGVDWQEEVYQRIKIMNDMYLSELTEMYQKIAFKYQQHDAQPQPPKSEQIERIKMFKTMLERIITFLQVSKNNVLPTHKDKLDLYEKQIWNVLNSNRQPQGQQQLLHDIANLSLH